MVSRRITAPSAKWQIFNFYFGDDFSSEKVSGEIIIFCKFPIFTIIYLCNWANLKFY